MSQFRQLKLKNFLACLPHDIDENIEDGFYVHHLKGLPVKMLLDETRKIVAIGNILSEKDEMLKL